MTAKHRDLATDAVNWYAAQRTTTCACRTHLMSPEACKEVRRERCTPHGDTLALPLGVEAGHPH